MSVCISNPPYNMKWQKPIFAEAQNRFNKCILPPENNANYAFILTALQKADKATFILPCGTLSSNIKEENEIRQYLVDNNFIDSIILCPNKMFESTNIPVCIITLDKNKKDNVISMLDMRNKYKVEKRDQNGQFGSVQHTSRTYIKEVNVITDESMNEAVEAINSRAEIKGYSYPATIEEIKENNYILIPSRFIEIDDNEENKRRDIDSIIDDINRITRDKNILKITMNETLAKNIGYDELKESMDNSNNIVESMNINYEAFTNKKIDKLDFIMLSKNKNEIKIENKDKEKLSEIIMLVLQMWKSHIMYLNNEENRYLVELRDTLLPKLMSGEIRVNSDEE